MLRVHHWRATAFILAVLAVGCNAVGCSKEDLTGAFDKAKDAVTEGTEKVKEAVQENMETTTEQVQQQLNLAGSFDLTAGEPLKIDACYVRFLPQGAGRPTILQLQSYRDADRESFPSAFLQAHVQVNSLADLVGEPLSARLFVQREDPGPILCSDVSKPIEFKITSVEDQTVSIELTPGVLRNTSTGAEIPVTGSMTGVLE